MSDDAPSFERDGAQHHPGALSPLEVEAVLAAVGAGVGNAGRRLAAADLATLPLGALRAIASTHLKAAAFPVRAVLFDKTRDANWVVAWHQDRTIPVRERIETAGFGPWSTKAGQLHVAPPITTLEGMATLRLHLDPCDDTNAPLQVALGTHRLGLVSADKAKVAAEGRRLHSCHAGVGDVWAYSTPILHASASSSTERRRRVLQVDFATEPLPGGLVWAF